MKQFNRYFITGVLTIIPIWVTWVVLKFFVQLLFSIGKPWVSGLSHLLQPSWPALSEMMLQPWFSYVLAVLLTLFGVFAIGYLTSIVLGRRILHLFEKLLSKIPVITTIYGAVKKLISLMQQPPGDFKRVVLIAFPSRDMKTVGFVTQTMRDEASGQELAVVYVPTTPNPTSGYMEIVPVGRLTPTDWTLEEAMTFVISAGAVTPEKINYSATMTDAQQA